MFNRKRIISGFAIAAGLILTGAATAGATEARHGRDFVAPVLRGVQIYKCTQQADGTFAFTQFDVRAKLKHRIRHSFVQTTTGPPQWIAPDGSAVTGAVVSRTPNGEGNIPLLELSATQIGRPHGRLSKTVRILRLNTKGGVAPAGTCAPDTIAKVPYEADYHFLSE
jgi:hypothetical protein